MQVTHVLHQTKLTLLSFLLAELLFQSLLGRKSVNAIDAELRNLGDKSYKLGLTGDLKGTTVYDYAYNRALERIERQIGSNPQTAFEALAWIAFAKRLLTTKKLEEAFGIQLGASALDRDQCPHIDDIISWCAGLVIRDVKSDAISLVHGTAQQYLSRNHNTWFPEIHLDAGQIPDAESLIAMCCVTHLSFDEFASQIESVFEASQQDPVLDASQLESVLDALQQA